MENTKNKKQQETNKKREVVEMRKTNEELEEERNTVVRSINDIRQKKEDNVEAMVDILERINRKVMKNRFDKDNRVHLLENQMLNTAINIGRSLYNSATFNKPEIKTQLGIFQNVISFTSECFPEEQEAFEEITARIYMLNTWLD